MSHYVNQIEFAHRVGKLSEQYSSLTKNFSSDDESIKSGEVYEATLHICLMQGLLTYCKERLEECWRSSFFVQEFDDVTPFWGLTRSMVTTNRFYTDHYGDVIKRATVITRLRNAVSHPHKVDPTSDTPSTGFISVIRQAIKLPNLHLLTHLMLWTTNLVCLNAAMMLVRN